MNISKTPEYQGSIEAIKHLTKHCEEVEAELARLRKKAGEWADRTAECSEEECGKTCCICIAGEMRREAAKGEK